jgi:uncharacterized protein YggE
MRVIVAALMTALGLGAIGLIGRQATPASAQDDLRSTVSVVGDGRVLVQPDTIFTGFGVESASTDLTTAQNDAFARMQSVIDAVVAQGVPREDIKTRSINITPEYDQQQRTSIRGYRVSSSIQVQIRDVTAAGQIIAAAVAAGANRVDGINFSVADQTPFKDQARAMAMTNARQKADQLASLAGLRVTAVKSISESDATSTPVRAERAVAAAPAAAAPPVEPGEQEIRTQVSVTYIIE